MINSEELYRTQEKVMDSRIEEGEGLTRVVMNLNAKLDEFYHDSNDWSKAFEDYYDYLKEEVDEDAD